MIEAIVDGIIQGVTAWIPVNSESIIALAKIKFFHATNVQDMIRQSLFLHLGTLLAALIYLRKDVVDILKTMFAFQDAKEETKKIFFFLLCSSLLSGLLGFSVLFLFFKTTYFPPASGKIITFLIAILLFITATMQRHGKDQEMKNAKEIKPADTIVLGFVQGLCALPGLSRSGITVACLLMRQFNKTTALRLSFLMSLPIVFTGTLVLGMSKGFTFSWEAVASFIFAFIFGFLSMHGLFKFAERMTFSNFTFCVAFLTIFSTFL